MRILVASTFVPLRPQSADVLAAWLSVALAERGHDAERVRIPFAVDPATLLEQALALRLTEISDVGELLIAVGAPAYLLRHRRKVLWLPERDREPDPWSVQLEQPGGDRQGMLLRETLIAADKLALGEAQRVFAGSRAGCERLRRSNGVAAEPLPSPIGRADSVGAWDDVVGTLAV
jgi:hypothetical protein